MTLLVSCGGNDSAQGDNSGQISARQEASAQQKVYNWKLVTTWPKNFPGLGVAPENFAKLVNRMSNGRLKVKVYAAG
ncbi:MAG: ABC transporter substrate-binding protein, partial [Pseudomonadales bacterium]|nr:ABC transporter substrate-binding protein [Pseudomonadales bacterium]